MKYFKICYNLIKCYMYCNIFPVSCIFSLVILKHIASFPFIKFPSIFVGQAYLWTTDSKI